MVFQVDMLNTYAALIFPMTIMTFGVFFKRPVIMGIPDELLEAARIDGASEWWIYLRIVLHLSKSGLMALGVFAFSEAWANLIWLLVVVSSGDMYTTELGLAVYQRQFFTKYGPIVAGGDQHCADADRVCEAAAAYHAGDRDERAAGVNPWYQWLACFA